MKLFSILLTIILISTINFFPQVIFTPHTIATDADGASSVRAADLDGDGDVDVLAAAFIDDKVIWYENDGNENFTAHTITTSADGATSVYALDLDGDLDIDVLSSSEFDDKIAWYENDGYGNFNIHIITTNAWGAYSVFAIDVDEDLDMDVLSAAANADEIAWYENDGNQNFTPHTITTNANGAYSVFAVDLDGDGDVDVLSASYEDDKIAWYENDGNENFTAHTITTSADGALSVYAIDIDSDMDIDILSASNYDDKIAWYENDGNENFTAHTITTSADGASSVYTVDVDGDNFIDVLSASWNDKRIGWYENPLLPDTLHLPSDYLTIQMAIDAAYNGDIVLVAEDTYYENINFQSKALTVASYFLLDNDESHIANTIINGSQPSNPDSASVVTFNHGEDTTSVLCGFTITGGTGTYSAEWDDRNGGGIYLDSSGAKICNNIIESNSVSYLYAWGGGISAYSLGAHNLIIENNIIRNNYSDAGTYGNASGGGIDFWSDGYFILKNNKILNNEVIGELAQGGGIECAGPINQVFIISNQVVGNSVHSGNYLMGGGGIDIYNCINNIPVVLNNLIANNFTTMNGGGVRIKFAMDDLFNMKSTKYQINSHEKGNSEIFILENNTIVNNEAGREGGGLHCVEQTEIMNCIVWGNEAPTGAQFSQNLTADYCDIENGISGGVGNINEDPLFTDTVYYTLTDFESPCIDSGNPDQEYNDVEDPNNSGYALPPAYGLIRNDIGYDGGPNSLWHYWRWPFNLTLPQQPVLVFPEINASLDSTTVLFIWETSQPLVSKYWFELDTADNFNTALMIGEVTDTTLLLQELNENDNYWWRVRAFNAVGWGNFGEVRMFTTTVASVNSEKLTIEYSLDQNYPNPFNPNTKIKYSVPKSNVVIKVFDVLGNEIETLLNEEKQTGTYELTWYGENLPSGVYFYRIQAGSFVETKKMVLMK